MTPLYQQSHADAELVGAELVGWSASSGNEAMLQNALLLLYLRDVLRYIMYPTRYLKRVYPNSC